MADDSAAYYKSLFLGQVEKGEQAKKSGSKRRKSTGSGPSSAKKSKKRALTPPSEDVVEVDEVIGASTKAAISTDVITSSTDAAATFAMVDVTPISTRVAAPSEVAATSSEAVGAVAEVPAGVVTLFTPSSPTSSVELLGSLPKSPTAKRLGRRRKDKGKHAPAFLEETTGVASGLRRILFWHLLPYNLCFRGALSDLRPSVLQRTKQPQYG